MLQKLPHSNYQYLTQDEIEQWKINIDKDLPIYKKENDPILSYNPEGDIGYYLEVDLHCPGELHDYFSDYPLFPESSIVTEDMKSEWQKSFKKKSNVEKLLLSLTDRHNYFVHIRMLKLGVELGYEITKIHSIVSFHQQAWIAPYITFNAEKRKVAKTPYIKDKHKLCNNIIYGKTCETDAEKFLFELINNPEQAIKAIHKDSYTGQYIIYDNDLVGMTFKPLSYKYKRNLPVACSILDFSKYLMFNYYYNIMKPHYDTKSTPLELQRCRMLYTDTDSYILQTTTKMSTDRNVFYDYVLPHHKEIYLSSYSDKHIIWKNIIDYVINIIKITKNSEQNQYELEYKCFNIIQKYGKDDPNTIKQIIKLFQSENEGILGKFKDENGEDNGFSNYIALRAKCYALIIGGHTKGKCKGVITTIKYDDYYNALFNNISKCVSQTIIRSIHHVLGIQIGTKIAFTVYDDKRYIINEEQYNLINTLPYGHQRI